MTDAPKDLSELKRAVEFELMRANATIPPYPKNSPSQNILALIDGLIGNLSSQEISAKERNIKALKIIDERIKELEDSKGFFWQDEMWRKNVHTEYKELRSVLGVK